MDGYSCLSLSLPLLSKNGMTKMLITLKKRNECEFKQQLACIIIIIIITTISCSTRCRIIYPMVKYSSVAYSGPKKFDKELKKNHTAKFRKIKCY